jgi:DNA repair photolyase
MYEFISHTWNTIKGDCYHDCSYCYMKRWGKLKPVRFDERELKTDLGTGNTIFVGSSCDMFAVDIPEDWIRKTLDHCKKFDNTYFFQSKNPSDMAALTLPEKYILCTTIETNRHYVEFMRNSPPPRIRAKAMQSFNEQHYLTIEPIMDFDLFDLVDLVKLCNPKQVNIGADSCGHNLPEPSKEKVLALIKELEVFTKVVLKNNLKRITI